MNAQAGKYSEEDMDYLREMMNIAAGNAAAALSQILSCEVEMELPEVFLHPLDRISSVIEWPSLPVLCIRTEMIGDVKGAIFFIVADDQKHNVLKLIRQAAPFTLRKKQVIDSSVMEEIGNIVTGVFLTAIHDFTRLNIYHTVPSFAMDMLQSLLDESIALTSGVQEKALIIQNDFTIKDGNVRTVLLVVPALGNIDTLLMSVLNAREELGIREK